MSNDKNRAPVIGGKAKADFLPPRIQELHDGRKNRHNLAISALVVTAVCGVSMLFVVGIERSSQALLSQQQTESAQILNRQNAYSDMVALTRESNNLSDAYVVASERNVNWSSFMQRIEAAVPSGGSLTNLDMISPASEDSIAAGAGATALTAVTVGATFTSPTIAGIEFFILDAQQWPGYQSSMVSQIGSTQSGYNATVQITFDVTALAPGAPQGVYGIASFH